MASSALTKIILTHRFTAQLLRYKTGVCVQPHTSTTRTLPHSFKTHISSCGNISRVLPPLTSHEHGSLIPPAILCVRARHSCSGLTSTPRWLDRSSISLYSCGTARGVNVGAVCTSGCHHKSDSSPHSQCVTSWEVVKKKEKNIREAGQEFLEDFKEKKAKVREKVDEIIERENIWTIPNFLCISRIAFSPVLVHLVVSSNYSWALGLFMFAGFTDLLDGWIARTFPGQASNIGSFLDPLADKVLVALLFLSLTYVGLIPLPLTGLIIYRDVLIIGAASYIRYKSLPPPRTITRYFDATHATAKLAPTTLSKFNTAVQLSLITASLAAPVLCFSDHYLLKGLWWLTAATTLSSGISYIFSRDTYKILSTMSKTTEK